MTRGTQICICPVHHVLMLRVHHLIRSFTTTQTKFPKLIPDDGKTLFDFSKNEDLTNPLEIHSSTPHYLDSLSSSGSRTFTIETYGCQMNVSDSEVVRAVLLGAGYEEKARDEESDLVLLNTCAIRDKAEKRIWQRLRTLRKQRGDDVKLGVLGCMAERLKEKLLIGGSDAAADLVVGPDAYRDLPHLLRHVLLPSSSVGSRVKKGGEEEDEEEEEESGFNMSVQLSVDETYADIAPVRDNHSRVSAFTTIMRGCNNMCSFCIVPHVRGRERSRERDTILDEVRKMSDEGYKEVILLGQNVNSYFDGEIQKRKKRRSGGGAGEGGRQAGEHHSSDIGTKYVSSNSGFHNLYTLRDGMGHRFSDLLSSVADINPEMRVRFTSPHPKDFPEDVLDVIAAYPNIARGIHMPIQSGSDRMLNIMRRNHTRDAYLTLIQQFRTKIPDVEFSTDLITGFCGETEEDHLETLSMLKEVEYEMAFMFAYSMRERTHAWHKVEKGVWQDDVTELIKKRRLKEIVNTYREIAYDKSIRKDKNKIKLILVEGMSKKSKKNEQNVVAGTAAALEKVQLTGRTDTFKRLVFGEECPSSEGSIDTIKLVPGDYVAVRVDEAAVSTCIGTPLYRTTLSEFVAAA